MSNNKSTILTATIALVLSAASVAVSAPEDKSPFGSFKRPGKSRVVTYALIGDTPYGDEQVGDFPYLIDTINADNRVSRVVHVGDIKNGSSLCSDEYFAFIFDSFASFEYPVVYTPGDNEWTDCHRSAAGKYDPIERLDAIRSIFFANPFSTLGGVQAPLVSQARSRRFSDMPENQGWVEARTIISTVHVVGSRNNLAPWFGDDSNDELEDQRLRREAEVLRRTLASLRWISATFEAAENPAIRGVLLFMHADTWPGGEDDGFSEIIQLIASRTEELGKPVLVVQGDSHSYKVDQPLLDGDIVHGVDYPVENLTRLVVERATTGEYLRLTIDPRANDLFSWERVN